MECIQNWDFSIHALIIRTKPKSFKFIRTFYWYSGILNQLQTLSVTHLKSSLNAYTFCGYIQRIYDSVTWTPYPLPEINGFTSREVNEMNEILGLIFHSVGLLKPIGKT